MKRRSLSVTFFAVVALLLSTAFGLYLGWKRVTDPFLYYDVSFVKTALTRARIDIPDTGPFASLEYVPGRQVLMLEFANMMGVEP